jgi:hypothetical protein
MESKSLIIGLALVLRHVTPLHIPSHDQSRTHTRVHAHRHTCVNAHASSHQPNRSAHLDTES